MTDDSAYIGAAGLIWSGAAGRRPDEAETERAGRALRRALEAGRAVPRGPRTDAPLWAVRDDLE